MNLEKELMEFHLHCLNTDQLQVADLIWRASEEIESHNKYKAELVASVRGVKIGSYTSAPNISAHNKACDAFIRLIGEQQ